MGLTISVIVCTRNRAAMVARLVRSLNAQEQHPHELIIVDSSSNNETQKRVLFFKKKTPYRVLYLTAKPNAARQRNIGFDQSVGSILCFLDDDVVLDSGYLKTVADTFKKIDDVKLAGITGKITNIPEVQSRKDAFFKRIFMLSDFGDGKVKPSGFPSFRTGNRSGYTDVLSGCNFVVIRSAFSEFRFDESLGDYSYMEDVDLSYRISRKFTLFYQPLARLEHLSETTNRANHRSLRRRMVRNHRYLFCKNMPKGLSFRLAHLWSLFGVILYNAILCRNVPATIGALEGMTAKLPNHSNKFF